VSTNERLEEPSSFETGVARETLAQKDDKVYLPTRTEAGRLKESVVEDLQPLNEDPPLQSSCKAGKQKGKKSSQETPAHLRDTRTSYSLRRDPKKARSKDLT
jgi:hypothetical protein